MQRFWCKNGMSFKEYPLVPCTEFWIPYLKLKLFKNVLLV